MVYLAISIAFLGMIALPLGRLYIGIKSKNNPDYTESSATAKIKFYTRLINIALFAIALIIILIIMNQNK